MIAKQPLRILLIDDDQEDHILTRDLLDEALGSGFHLDWASTFDSGIEAIRQCHHDLYLLDYRLGKNTGLDVLRDPAVQNCDGPIILLTGQSEREIDLEAMQAGAADFLTKDGLTAETLERTIRHSMERFRHRRELQQLNEELESRVEERTRELERAMEKLREADRRKDEFLAILAHELRNPLAPISNSLELIRNTEIDAETLAEARQTMERQLAQLTRLVDDLLEVNRISQGKIELRKGVADAAKIVLHAVEASRPLMEKKKQHLRLDLPTEPVELEVDDARLAQVISNLLNNASKYTDPSGQITLTLAREGEFAVVRVCDTGVGLSEESLSKIFEMFAQVDSTLERSQGGLGIGLTLARTLVELHDGTLTASSAGPGCGSEFTIRIPAKPRSLQPMTAPTPSSPQPAKPPGAGKAGRKVLVVDDNRDSATTLAMLLKLSAHTVEKAHDGEEALEAAQRFLPEVILLDIGLPKLNGYEVVRKLREQPWGKGMKVIALTGWGQEEDRQKSKDAGFDDHIVKPVQHAALVKLLSEH